MEDPISEPRVNVRAYSRVRFGRNEHVRAHTRSWPKQLTFEFMRQVAA